MNNSLKVCVQESHVTSTCSVVMNIRRVTIKIAEGSKILVCIVNGLHADLVKTGVHLSICLLLQQQGLLMDSAQWTAKQTATGFSVSFFWPRPPGQCRQYGTKNGRRTGRRRKRKRRGLKTKSGTTTLTSNAAAAIPIGSAAKRETRRPLSRPIKLQLILCFIGGTSACWPQW